MAVGRCHKCGTMKTLASWWSNAKKAVVLTCVDCHKTTTNPFKLNPFAMNKRNDK